MKKFLFAAAALLTLAACNNDETTLSISTESMVFSSEGGSQSFNITSNSRWTITGGADWAKLSETSGRGDATINVTVGAYTGNGQSTTYTVTADDIVYSLNIIQERTPLPKNPEHHEGEAGNAAIDSVFQVPAGYDFHVNVTVKGAGDEEAKADESIAKVTSQDGTSFTLHVEPNETGEDRVINMEVLTSDNQLITTYTLVQRWGSDDGDFVIDEVFFAGNPIEGTDNNDSIDGDQYIRITNTSSKTLYADRLAFVIGETDSQLSSAGATWTYPDEPDSIGINTMYLVPGDGTKYPVAAGESIVIAIAAQDFTAENPLGCDLSKANFELFDENDVYPDTDNPDVDNMDLWFKSSFTITSLHNRGFESLAIARVPDGVTVESFMADYAWKGQRVMDWNGYHFDQDIKDAYLVPNDWVVDAVNLAIPENLGTLAFNATVDAGYTNVSTVDHDENRFGKAVARKHHADTNNSTNDFEIVTPSMRK